MCLPRPTSVLQNLVKRLTSSSTVTLHRLISLVCVTSLLLATACLPEDPIQKTVQILDQAVNNLSVANANWQVITKQALAELPKEMQQTVGVELSSTMNRAIDATGVELRCGIDFLRSRVLEDVIRTRAAFLKEPVPPPKVVVCRPEPPSIRMDLEAEDRKDIEFFGYNFDLVQRPRAILKSAQGSKDVSAQLSIGSHYQMILLVSRINFTTNSDRVSIEGPDGELLSEVPVRYGECRTETAEVVLEPKVLRPRWVSGGDEDFAGHGPLINLVLSVGIEQNAVRAHWTMSALEASQSGHGTYVSTGDRTRAEGSLDFDVYTPQGAYRGWKVVRLDGLGSISRAEYYDENRLDDTVTPQGGIVDHFECVGDTEGNEAGSETLCKAHFRNPIPIVVQQVDDCIP